MLYTIILWARHFEKEEPNCQVIMQLFAYENDHIISADAALRGKNYSCPECRGTLRLKESLYRRKYFFHLKVSSSCRQSKKSDKHLAVQKALESQLPQGDVVLEKSFPSIGRIADVVWISRKCVFEVQCSPISLEEVLARNADYAQADHKVIWILHDDLFNKKKLSPAEHFLRGKNTLFTNINRYGQGILYDQFEKIFMNRRVYRGQPRRVSPTNLHFYRLKNRFPEAKSSYFKHLKKLGRLYFLYLLNKNSGHP